MATTKQRCKITRSSRTIQRSVKKKTTTRSTKRAPTKTQKVPSTKKAKAVVTKKITQKATSRASASSAKAVARKAAEKKRKSTQTKRAKTDIKSTGMSKKTPTATKKETKTKVIKKIEKAAEPENQLPIYLTTPSKAILKSFQGAAKKRQQLVKKLSRSKRPKIGFLAALPRSGKRYVLDLRIHTPGTSGYFSTSGVEAGSALVRLAKVKGIEVLGLTDYYNASYIDIVQEAAKQAKLTVVPGFDMKCKIGACEDVRAVVLFPENFDGARIFEVLQELQVPESAHGSKDYCLELPFTEILEIIERNNGVVIPSRLDKTPNRESAFPMLIEEYGFHTFDLVHPENTSYFIERWPQGGFTFLSFSNANTLAQVGSRTASVKLTAPGFEGVKQLVNRRI